MVPRPFQLGLRILFKFLQEQHDFKEVLFMTVGI
jgi:hypothetical protein